MARHHIRSVPVVSNGSLVGILDLVELVSSRPHPTSPEPDDRETTLGNRSETPCLRVRNKTESGPKHIVPSLLATAGVTRARPERKRG